MSNSMKEVRTTAATGQVRMSIADQVFETVAESTPELRDAIRGRRGKTDSTNRSGERQRAADLWFDELLAERLGNIDGVGTYASEERTDPVDVGDGLSVTVDPLDGSSNLDSNNLVGTVVGVYDGALPAHGRDLVGAAFVIYGPTITMVSATAGTVSEYEVVHGELECQDRDLKLPADPSVFGFGGGVDEWSDAFESYAEGIRENLKLRYGGALVGDVNQVLGYGGVFAYPALKSKPAGKLRHQFEAAPIAYIVECAGGRSSDGRQSILEIEPGDLHERCPLHVGNKTLIDELERTLAT